MTQPGLEVLQQVDAVVQELGLTVTRAYSSGKLSPGRMLLLAAVAPEGSTDPVDRAMAASLKVNRPDIPLVTVPAADFDAASPDRKFSLARVHDFEYTRGQRRDLVIMRGELSSVLKHAQIDRESKTLLTKNADMMQMRGRRPLGIATAFVGADGTLGEFRVQGFIAVGMTHQSKSAADMTANPGQWIRVNVWSPLLRWQHWINVALIFTMSCTGYLIMDPFFGPVARPGVETGYLMGWIRFLHFVAAFSWLFLGATRLVLAFTTADRQLRWRALWPINSKKDLQYLGETAAHYAFIRKEAPLYLGHNPLQQFAYTFVYVACAVQMATGLALFGLYNQYNWFWRLMATPAHWIGVPALRLIHAVIMFLLWAFVIMHVYMAIRADSLERHGGISSMVNGSVWLRRGSKPVDAPKIG